MTTLDIKLRPKGRVVRLSGAAVPAKKDVDQSTYRGRFAARLFLLRAGRDVERIIAGIERAGFDKCGKSTYYSWESGRTEPPLDALPALAKALGVKIEDLLPPK